MKTSEVLNKAADLLRERGWIGEGGQGWEGESDDPLCIEGAIRAAMGPEIGYYGGFTTGPNNCPAGQAVRDYLELGEWSIGKGLFTWNDEQVVVVTRKNMVPSLTAGCSKIIVVITP